MRYHQRTPRRVKPKKKLLPIAEPPRIPGVVQPFEAFLVLDVEGTCNQGTDFNYPNEIIELPVFLLQWKDRTEDGIACTLEVVDEFRTFVKPTWRPVLSDFCMELTGITQEQVDSAPRFSEALVSLEAFLVKHGLLEAETGKRQKRFCWCSDGPWDIRDFFVKQCFISKVEMPDWIRGDVLDVRFAVLQWKNTQTTSNTQAPVAHTNSGVVVRPSFNIPAQLKVLGFPAFEGRQHSGIDDTRNISKIVIELGRRGVLLLPNTTLYPNRRWRWMGKYGQVLEDGLS
ncbi:hypothetical protein M413DRAFT_61219 [Hebeloma cylindrosporum]|uniref:Exonuclease domain-containing protein n=1 Tax=Hebeloma cylindrosporum TaxID=76867 RepID=A0A0C2Z6R1_HEBCY|nr:hypothetical protein M413DRAFT_61219 [Hebeloma cylindrosporum h7]